MPSIDSAQIVETTSNPYFTLSLERDFTFSIQLSLIALFVVIGILLAIYIVKRLLNRTWKKFEIDNAEFGLGSTKFTFKPNRQDQQIAYKIWVELSTRKIGLPINLEHDVIAEVYDSWYTFFTITRELIKDIPVNKVKNSSTSKIIDLSISVLNEGLRPHLTLWQARFRHWYDLQLKEAKHDIAPQAIQATYPEFDKLKSDLMEVNENLIRYREKMKALVLGSNKNTKKKVGPNPSLSE